MRGALYRALLRLAAAVKPTDEDAPALRDGSPSRPGPVRDRCGRVVEWQGKLYLICTRCGNDEFIHPHDPHLPDRPCGLCSYIIARGICWACLIADVEFADLRSRLEEQV